VNYYPSEEIIDGKQLVYMPLDNATITYMQITLPDALGCPKSIIQ